MTQHISLLMVLVGTGICLFGLGACVLAILRRDWSLADRYSVWAFWGGVILAFYLLWANMPASSPAGMV